jgi:hypothetical protein
MKKSIKDIIIKKLETIKDNKKLRIYIGTSNLKKKRC